MDDQPGLSDQYRMSSPWPVFVALGLVLSELGVLLGIIPLSIGGLLLFTGSIAGIITEAGYTEQWWGILGGLGVVLVVLGGILIGTQLPNVSVSALVSLLSGMFGAQPNGIVIRGASIVMAGVIAVVLSKMAQFVEPDLDPL